MKHIASNCSCIMQFVIGNTALIAIGLIDNLGNGLLHLGRWGSVYRITIFDALLKKIVLK